MNDEATPQPKAQRFIIVMLTLSISAVFLVLVSRFLIALFFAAVASSMAYPLYSKVLSLLRGRRGAAAAATLLILILIVLIPALVLLDLVATQAYQLAQQTVPWLEQNLKHPEGISFTLPGWVPFRDQIESSGPQIATKIGELISMAGGYLVQGLSAATKGTAGFFLDLFIMLYAMLFFLRSGPPLVEKMIDYLPLSPTIQKRLLDKGLSVTRATIKGTLVIGLVQGTLGGLSFAVVGIHGAAFWGATMALASVVPSVGTAVVWVPAVIYLLVTGQLWAAFGLGLWCALVVGSADNVLRPVLVGGDTQMPDLLILISTFGGLASFGIAGLVIGPVIASLFVTMWDVYHETFPPPLGPEEREATEAA